MNTLCIYHGNCADGFGAAWAVRHALLPHGPVEFHAGIYGKAPPDVTNRHVVLVDFSYKRPVLLEMYAKAATILVLDHHKTAAEDLDGLPRARKTWAEHIALADAPGCSAMGVLFDMERSGAGIAWDYFHPDEARPALINHLEDRDLWRFKLPRTREIQAAAFSHPYTFEAWDMLMHANLDDLAREGAAIERKHHKDIAELVAVTKRNMVIGGVSVPVANLPYTLTSDAGHLMAEGQPFAACYWDTPSGRVFSLRSRPEGADVSEIAKGYGGGGHKNASGFTVPFDHPLGQG